MTFAMVFPGQGSQSLGMQAMLAEAFPAVRETYAEASEVLGYDLWKLVQEGPQEELDKTVVTQPAMLTAGVATSRCWAAAGGPTPGWLAGHSLGEYSALVWAEAVSFGDALALVRQRAALMQEAVPAGEGAMAAILGLDDETVVRVCEQAAEGQVVTAVNFNSPGQVVVAGQRDAVSRAVERAKQAGARRALMLRVSVPSHSPLMQPAADALAERLAATEFAEVRIPVLNSVDVEQYLEPEQIRAGLRRQVFNPVRWTDTVRCLRANGVDTIIECGPGKVLAGLIRRIDRSAATICIDDAATLEQALAMCGRPTP